MTDLSNPSLKERLAAELRTAMKGRERVRVGALRMLTASVKNREVEVGHELSDEEFVEVAVRGFWDPAFAPLRGALGYSDSLRALLALQALGGLAVGLYLMRVGRYLRSGSGGSGSVRL